LSVWDSRICEKNGCIQRIAIVGGPLYSLACGVGQNAGTIAVGGAGRSVVLVDCRKWTGRNRATNLTKYEISSLSLSEQVESVCYVGGVDSELVCRDVSNVVQKEEKVNKAYGGGHYNAFRGDGKWIGLDCTVSNGEDSPSPSVSSTVGSEVLVGSTDTGSLYAFYAPHVLASV